MRGLTTRWLEIVLNIERNKMRNGMNITTKERADKAFNIYYALGTQRSLEKLRETMGKEWGKISIKTLESWSIKYQWQSRIAEMARKVQAQTEKKLLRDTVEIKVRQQGIIDAALASILTRFKEAKEGGLLPEFTYQDLERILKHELLLHGIVKEGPPVVNPMQFMQINLTPEESRFKRAMLMLPPKQRYEIIRQMDAEDAASEQPPKRDPVTKLMEIEREEHED